MNTFSRRAFIELAGTTALVSAASVSPYLSSADAAEAIGNMAVPGYPQRPMFRWWWPGGYIEPDEVVREVNAMADAGFGGFEIADVTDGLKAKPDPKIYGWGSERWCRGVEAALTAAEKRGMRPDITIGAHWPTGMPGVTPDDPAAAQELVHGAVAVTGGNTFSGALPRPKSQPTGIASVPSMDRVPVTEKVLRVMAFRQIGAEGKAALLDPKSLTDLTAKVSGTRLDWRAPDNGTWQLIVLWTRGTSQIQGLFRPGNSDPMLAYPTPFVVDIFGRAGAQACIDYWEKHLLSARAKVVLGKLGGNFFEDSLELNAAQHWSPDLLGFFERRRGYSLIPYLPLLAVPPGETAINPLRKGLVPCPFAIKGVDRAALLDDFDRTLGEMYVENRLKPIDAWAKTFGMGFRAQCIGGIVDSGNAAANISVPEGDNSCDMDGMRVLAAGRDIGGKRILSCETATFVGGQAYNADWRLAVFMMQRDCAGGVNQLVIHGYPYEKSPTATWPGYSAFGKIIGNDWGPRMPQWKLASEITPYLSRLTAFLQKGRCLTDIAILYQKTGVSAHYGDEGLRMAGYTYQFPDRELLYHKNAIVRGGILAPKGPCYKALVINQERTMDVKTAARILKYAKAGLPVFVIGAFPKSAAAVVDASAEDKKLQRLTVAILALENVHRVASDAALVPALRKCGIVPTFGYSAKSRITGLRRREGQTDYYYLLNDSDAPVALDVSLPDNGVPYHVDLWNGKITPVATYVRTGGRIRFSWSFAANDPSFFIVSPSRKLCGALPASNVVKASGGDWTCVNGRLAVRADHAGTYSAKLANGRSISVSVPAVPAASTLTKWSLDVEDWRPGKSANDVEKRYHSVELDGLKPWSAIEPLADVSGIGRYRTSVSLDKNWNSSCGAVLDLGYVAGTFRIEVNGRRVPPVNQFRAAADIGPYLKPGVNEIEIFVATTLNNRLRVVYKQGDFHHGPGSEKPVSVVDLPSPKPLAPPTGQYLGAPKIEQGPILMLPGSGAPGGKRWRLDYGLIGPVVFKPYRVLTAGK